MTEAITPPSNIDYGTVVWRAAIDVVDSSDPGTEPDFIPPTGTVTFVSTVGKLLDPGALPDPLTVIRDPIVGVLDDEGYLCTPDEAGLPAYRGVQLIATDDPDLNPLNPLYNVSYQLRGRNGRTLKYPESHQIAVPTGAEVDLTNFIPPDGTQTIGIPQAEALAAQAAADAAAAQAALVEALTTFVRFRDTNGDPIVGGVVTITVNTTTGQIADIVYEEV